MAPMATETLFSQLEIDEQKRLLDKLTKLKALSECQTGNVNETATAAATMTRIMLEYQIGMADLSLDQSQDDSVVDEPILSDSYNGYPMWKKTILSALAEVNHCVSYTGHEPDDYYWTRRTRSRLSVIGAPKDVESTRRLFVFCVDEVQRLCSAWGPRQPVKRRNDFKRGAASGIAQKVRAEREQVLREEQERAQEKEQDSLALALFARKEQAVAEYAGGLGIKTTTIRSRAPSRDAYHAGYEAGSNMNLARGSMRGLPPGRG